MSNARARRDSIRLTYADGAGWRVDRDRAHPPAAHFGRRFVVVFEDMAPMVDALRSTTALKLVHRLPWMLMTSGFRRVDQRQLAEELKTSQPVVSRALSDLVRVGIVEREGKGPGTRYRLSPRVAWRGTAGSYHAAEKHEGRRFGAEAHARALTAQLDLLDPPEDQ